MKHIWASVNYANQAPTDRNDLKKDTVMFGREWKQELTITLGLHHKETFLQRIYHEYIPIG